MPPRDRPRPPGWWKGPSVTASAQQQGVYLGWAPGLPTQLSVVLCPKADKGSDPENPLLCHITVSAVAAWWVATRGNCLSRELALSNPHGPVSSEAGFWPCSVLLTLWKGPGLPWEEHSNKSEKMETGSDRSADENCPEAAHGAQQLEV